MYLPTLSHDFTYDDKVAIQANPDVHAGSQGIWGLWKHDFWGNAMMGSERNNHTWTHNSWRPLVVLGLRMEKQLAGSRWGQPAEEGGTGWVLHLSSVLMHAGLAVGVSRVIAMLMLLDEHQDGPQDGGCKSTDGVSGAAKREGEGRGSSDGAEPREDGSGSDEHAHVS